MPVKITKKTEQAATDAQSLPTALGVQAKSHFTVIKTGKVEKADKQVLVGADIEKDDAFEPYYFDPRKQDAAQPQVLRPPFNPAHLALLAQKNNTLGQLITAMEVNIDGTGWVIEKREIEEEDEEEDDEISRITGWFDEPYPRVSLTTLRRKVRRDLESCGYAYIEVLRSVDGEIMFLKRVETTMMRLVKLDDPVDTEQTVFRNGEKVTINMSKRERRFAMVQGKKVIYFKEYGASRDLNKITGEWHPKDSLPATDRATEVLYLTVHEDVATAYGVPRWINQIPSILGSRKAEELNLDFFYSGGLPPALIFIQGGELTSEVRKSVQSYLSGRGSSIHRGGVIEVAATGGSLEHPGNVKVTVERFGSERMQDSMFENYDQRCEERVRAAFRLPPIFMGKSQDYSFATAYASYTVAEAQVFVPEREEFDEVINTTIMRELDETGEYVFRSLPLTVNDVAQQLEGLTLVTNDVSREGRVEAVNSITGLQLKVDEEADARDEEMRQAELEAMKKPQPVVDPNATGEPKPPGNAQPGKPPAAGNGGGKPTPGQAQASKMDTFDMMHLVNSWCRSILEPEQVSKDEVSMIERVVKAMDPNTRKQFDTYAAMRMMGALDFDFEGTVELVGAAAFLDAHEHTDDHCG